MNYKPTESELEILQVLWKQGNATVREVNELLSINKNKEVGYTTTLKLMQIMFEKGLLTRDSSSRTHTYKAAVEQKAAQQNLLTKLIDNLFNGSSSQLIMQALDHKNSSPEELAAIRKYLDDLEGKKDGAK